MRKMNEQKINEMFEFIKNYIMQNNGESPRFNNIIEYMNMSESVGYRYLLKLKDLGLVEYSGKNSLKISGQEKLKVRFKSVDVFGEIPCGRPEDNKQEIVGHIALPEEWIEGNCYLLKASGDSMIDAGIDSGDLVLIKEIKEACNGQIIVALTEDGVTLKRYMENSNGVKWLRAENNTYNQSKKEIFPNEITVQGLALKIIKDVR